MEWLILLCAVSGILMLCALAANTVEGEAEYHLRQEARRKPSGPLITAGTPWETPSWETDYLRQQEIEAKADEFPNTIREIVIRWERD